MWSREGDVTSISADCGSDEVAVGLSDGRVILYDSSTWEQLAVLQVEQKPVGFVKYGRLQKSNLPNPFLMVCIRKISIALIGGVAPNEW